MTMTKVLNFSTTKTRYQENIKIKFKIKFNAETQTESLRR